MRKPIAVTWDTVRQLAASLESTEESTSYGTPAMKVNGKLYARQHQDGEYLVVRVSKSDKLRLLRENPDVFHETPHYIGTPYVLVRLGTVMEEDLAAVLRLGWEEVAG